MTSYLTVSEFFPLQITTFYLSLERKFNADQLLVKDLVLKMYGTKVMSSYSDISVLEKLSPLKHDILYTIGKKIWRYSIFNSGLEIENVRNQGYDVIQWHYS